MTVNASDNLQAAADMIRLQMKQAPRLAVVLGSGLGGFVDELAVDVTIPYSSIPGMPSSTAIGHKGVLILGTLQGIPLVVLQGRTHLYEGYSRKQVTLATRLLKAAGIETLLLSCAAGGLNPRFSPGDLMLITDTVDLLHQRECQPANFLRPTFRPAISQEMNARLATCALKNSLPLVSGTYIAVTGPNYETRAEQRFLRMMGDAVGMSTVPEIAAASESGMQVAALAMITNVCTPDAPHETTGEEVLLVASRFLPEFHRLVASFAKTL